MGSGALGIALRAVHSASSAEELPASRSLLSSAVFEVAR